MEKNSLPYLKDLYEHLEAMLGEPELRYLDARRLAYLATQISHASHEWMRTWAQQHPRRTNWDMLPERTRNEYETLRFHGSPTCGNCGADISTEALFWQHFIIPNPDLPNLGECPTMR